MYMPTGLLELIRELQYMSIYMPILSRFTQVNILHILVYLELSVNSSSSPFQKKLVIYVIYAILKLKMIKDEV